MNCKIVVLLPFVSRGSSPLEVPLICAIRAFEVVHDMEPHSVDDLMSMFFLQGAAPDWADADVRHMVRDALQVEPFISMTPLENTRWIESNGAAKERTQAKRKKYIAHILTNEFLPHVCEPGQRIPYLGLVVRQLVSVLLGRRRADDRDHNGNKRLDGPGPLLGALPFYRGACGIAVCPGLTT